MVQLWLKVGVEKAWKRANAVPRDVLVSNICIAEGYSENFEVLKQMRNSSDIIQVDLRKKILDSPDLKLYYFWFKV